MKRYVVLLLKVGVYFFCLSASLVLAYNLKYGFLIPDTVQQTMWQTVGWLVSLKIIILVLIGEFKGIFSYFRLPDLFKIIVCFVSVSTGLALCHYFIRAPWLPERDILIADLLFSILFIFFFRASLRILNTSFFLASSAGSVAHEKMKIAVIGTNETASQIISSLKTNHLCNMQPIAVLDDNPKYHGRKLHGVPVVGTPERLSDLAERQDLQGVIFTGNLPQKRFSECAQLAQSLHLKAFNVPSIGEFLSGRAFASKLRPLEIEDFLARDPIRLNTAESTRQIEGKVIFITGAGGSIGSELSLQIAKKHPKTLVLIDHCEYNLFKIQQSLLTQGYACEPVLLNITHRESLRACFEKFKPHYVFHAAAYKHVPLLEKQALVAVQNNVGGTALLGLYAAEYGVEKFVLVSTDKAVHPSNNMGATKRICEMLCMALQQRSGNITQFMAVRFGNVLGTAGSVLPTFREQIARGGPITVTHPDMTRYFMTIPEAVSLILEAFTFKDSGGKIYILDMGQPVKILDIAKRMIELSGTIDIPIVFTGIRPGEKLHEELVDDATSLISTNHQLVNIYKENTSYVSKLEPVESYLDAIQGLETEDEALKFIRGFIKEFKIT